MSTIYAPKTGLYLPGTTGNYVSTPDHADLDLTGDLCLIARISLIDWTPTSPMSIISKWNTSNYSWLWQISPSGAPRFWWSSNGSATNLILSDSIISILNGNSVYTAITVDVSSGISNSDTKFWISLDGVSWTQLGTTQNTSTITFFSGNSNVDIGSHIVGTTGLLNGTIYSAQIYDGIGDNSAPGLGTLVAEFDASKCKPRYRDSTGKIWSITGSDVVTERVYNA